MSQQIFTFYTFAISGSQDLGKNSDIMYRIYQLNTKLDRISIHSEFYDIWLILGVWPTNLTLFCSQSHSNTEKEVGISVIVRVGGGLFARQKISVLELWLKMGGGLMR